MKQLHARPSVLPTAPVTPEHGLRSNDERMEQHAYLAWLCSGVPLPLTLLAQRTGATTADAGPIDHPQAPIGLSTLLMGYQQLVSRTTECAIWLESKVLPRETASFPGLAYNCRSVPLNRRSLRMSFL